MLNARAGFSFAELLVSMVVAGVVLAMFASVGLRERRAFTDLADRDALDQRLGEAAAMLPIELRALSATDGDLRDARDTSVELRQVIATGIVCDTVGGSLIFAPAISGAGTFASVVTQPDVGDSLWLYVPTDSADAWLPFRVASAASVAAGPCAPSGPRLAGAATTTPRLRIAPATMPATTVVGLPVRVTRPVRYSLYRASDGNWYLGARDWNPASTRFNTIQPVSGPFLSASQNGLTFRYEDSTGAVLAAPIANTHVVSLIQVVVRGQTHDAVQVLGASGTVGPRVDSVLGLVALRNRP